jgi:protein gp37
VRRKVNRVRSLLPVAMNQSKGFYRWGWDVITGCEEDCWYCYAKKYRKDFRPKFNERLLGEPYKVEPAMIFVNWLGDVMGEKIQSEWIEKILGVCRDLPDHTFLFMTKNPARYGEFKFPNNCILGVTIENPYNWWKAGVMEQYSDRKMCSIEPILGDFTGRDFSQFEFVVVGSLIGSDSHEYYETVKHSKIYYTR